MASGGGQLSSGGHEEWGIWEGAVPVSAEKKLVFVEIIRSDEFSCRFFLVIRPQFKRLSTVIRSVFLLQMYYVYRNQGT